MRRVDGDTSIYPITHKDCSYHPITITGCTGPTIYITNIYGTSKLASGHTTRYSATTNTAKRYYKSKSDLHVG